jgi:hypothetical protein
MASNSLSKSLSQFVTSANDSSMFDNPFIDDEIEVTSTPISKRKNKSKSSDDDDEYRPKKSKPDKFAKVMSQGNDMIDRFMDEDFIDDFDGFIGNFLLDDEDVELRRNLLRYGRKYARETKVSGETSEINKAYSESEKLLSELLDEINEDKKSVQTDINNMRMMRTRNYKALSDLIEAKSQFHNTALSAIKEMNSMKKAQFELQMKVDKTKKEESDDGSASNRAIQQLFGIGRDNIMGSLGGYEGVSGASEAGMYDDDNYSSGIDEDEIIQKKYFSSDEDDVETDGDKFLKYEGRGVHYILLYDDDGSKEIIAEDKDGNIVPDYPLPSNPDDLDFNISESTGTATDNLANNYELRHM